MKKSIYILTLIVLANIIFYINSDVVLAETTEMQEIDIETSPTKSVFNMNKMIPGDTATREVVISNNGKDEFKYLSKLSFVSGSKKLYDSLLLKISDADEDIYSGKLSDFNKMTPRYLSNNDQETLYFTIEMPYELGNDYQGLATEFELKFYVEGTLGGLLPVDNRLPSTATDMFNLLVAGAILIGFGILLFLFQRRKKVKEIKS
nr:LPXTG cell wall anchor domain-containing protein [Paenibacillus bovis]